MIRFLETPQLPQGRVQRVALGQRYAPLLRTALSKQGVEILPLPDNPALDLRLRAHADLSLLHLGGAKFLGAAELCWDNLTVCKIPTSLCDSALNCCAVGDLWLLCKATAAFKVEGKAIYVRQRYTRCSVCIVDKHSIITADHGIARACQDALDVLEVCPGGIELPGYSTGFLGGASFKLDPETLAFTGTLDAHSDKARIEAFLRQRKVRPLYLTDGPCLDIGSAVLLQEEIPEPLP